MTPGRRTLTREQVVRTERRAWLGRRTDGTREYFFDGINFWRRRGRMDAELIAPWRAPTSGWRHRDGCTCRLCSSKAVA
jgi:hypothetical protein